MKLVPEEVFYDIKLKENSDNYPILITPTKRIYLETFNPHYKVAYDFLITISQPEN